MRKSALCNDMAGLCRCEVCVRGDGGRRKNEKWGLGRCGDVGGDGGFCCRGVCMVGGWGTGWGL